MKVKQMENEDIILALQERLEEVTKERNLFLENLMALMDVPFVLDHATVPKLGAESNPDQVVGNLCVSGRIYKNARDAIEPYRVRDLSY